MGAPKIPPIGTEAYRLRLLITALRMPNDATFARRIDATTTRLSNVLGGSPIGRDLAFKIVRAIPGVTVDWLWFGNRNTLSYELVRKLDEAEEELAALGKGKTKAKS